MAEAFVYCWTDHKNNMLYVGSHKGSIDDGYICSSRYMMKEYRERPTDFTRQIISEGSVNDIRILESKILKSVNARLNEDFYNRHDNDGLFFDGWKKGEMTDEHRKNMSIAAKKRTSLYLDLNHLKKLQDGRRRSKNSLEHNAAIAKYHTGRSLEEQTKKKIGKSRFENNDTKKLASHAGKISAKKYKNNPERQIQHSERMKLWWAERKAKDNN